MSTPKQTDANRRNSQRSTGPRSTQGKAASRSNSLKTGLYARSQIISGEDPAELRALADRYFLRWDPGTPEESFLVCTLMDSDWLLRRYSLADAQIWDYQADNEYVLESPHPKGLNFIRCREYFPLLQRRSDSAQRTWHRALRDLERLQAKRPTPPPSTEKPASDPPPEPKPNSAQPQSVQQEIGFVPSFSNTPDFDPAPSTEAQKDLTPSPAPCEVDQTAQAVQVHQPVPPAHPSAPPAHVTSAPSALSGLDFAFPSFGVSAPRRSKSVFSACSSASPLLRGEVECRPSLKSSPSVPGTPRKSPPPCASDSQPWRARPPFRPLQSKRVPGVYLSYPFCAQKCTYCNFASGVFPRELEARYLDALAGEVRAHRWEWQPETVYLGGGTPSTIPPDALATLLDPLPGRPWKEATIEAAPGTITATQARAWACCGINRVSLGVQSFIETEIRRTGRKHTAQTVVDDIALLRDAGIHNCNIDLIAGLSGQTEATWRQSLDWVRRIAPTHVSIYMLEVDEDSRLGKELLLGGVRYGAADIPGDHQIAAFYEMAVELLASVGIQRYEISNFAIPGWESQHNLKYWKLEPYVGFGADAHSFDGRMRRQNPESVVEHLADSTAKIEELPHQDERFFVGLRMTQGIRPEPEEWRRFEEPIRRFVGSGLLETEDGVLRLTGRGVLFSNEVFQEFLN